MRRLLVVGFGDIAQRMVPLLRALDTRTAHLTAALAKGGSLPQHFAHIGIGGVRVSILRVPDINAADRLIAPNLRSFLTESRRLVNRRLKQELRVRLRFPTVREGIHG